MLASIISTFVTLKSIFLKQTIYFPENDDPVDEALADFFVKNNDPEINELRTLVCRVGRGSYKIGSFLLEVTVDANR